MTGDILAQRTGRLKRSDAPTQIALLAQGDETGAVMLQPRVDFACFRCGRSVVVDAAIAGERRPCEARQYFRGFLRQGFLLILRVCAGIDGIAGTAVGIAGGMTAVLAIAIVLAVFTVAVIVTLPHAERSVADNRLIGVGHVRAAHRQSRIRERQHSPVA